MRQLEISVNSPYPIGLVGNGPITKRFWEFHRANPSVYSELRKLALELYDKGHRHYGMKGLFEVLRWHRAMSTECSEFKLNNNYTALYSRLLMYYEPKLDGFFLVRGSSEQVIE